MRSSTWLVAALAAPLAACGGAGSPPPADPIASFTAEPAALLPGEGVTLRPVFTGGPARIDPGVGPVASGGAYPVAPRAEGITFTLTVETPAGPRARDLRVPFRYRERVTAIAPGEARTRHGAARLADGRVLIVGGASPGPVFWATSEVFDPATGAFAPAGELSTPRAGTEVVALPGGGALRLGGESVENSFEAATRVEAWDPAASAWTVEGHLVSNRSRHTATRLADGRVLVAGGVATGGTAAERDAEIWVPGSGSRQPAGEMLHRRAGHTATPLLDGRVLIAGGYLLATGSGAPEAEVFDPATETFAPAGTLVETRAYHAAVRLADGRVLLVGGDVVEAGLRRSAEVWSPTTGTFARAGELAAPRTEPEAVRLGSGEVLVAGGLVDDVTATAALEAWDPAVGTFRAWREGAGGARTGLSAHVLGDGRVLLVGGDQGSGFPVATAAIVD
jgi:hypothetical protein